MQLKYHLVTIKNLVPAEHFLRKLEVGMDLSFVYEETAHLYSRRYGRPPIGSVVMVKYLCCGYALAGLNAANGVTYMRSKQRMENKSCPGPGTLTRYGLENRCMMKW